MLRIGVTVLLPLAAVCALAAAQALGFVDKESLYATGAGTAFAFAFFAGFILFIRRHSRRYWREMLLTAGVVVLLLGILDVVLLRLRPEMAYMPYVVHVPSERFQHVMPANMTMRMDSADNPVIVRTNEDGLRTEYSRKTFLDHKVRIAVLGDSFAFGGMVPQDKTFPAVTEALLRSRLHRDDIAVLNAGHVSYSPYLEGLLFEGMLREYYQPTVVVLFLDATDFGDDYTYQHVATMVNGQPHFYRKPRPYVPHYCALQEFTRPYSNYLWNYVHFPKQFWDLHVNSQLPKDAADFEYYQFKVVVDGVEETNRYFIYRHPLASIEPFLRNTLENVNHIAAQAAAAGVPFVLFAHPRYHLWNVKESPQNWERGQYKLDEPYQYEYFKFLDNAAKESAYPIVNMLPAFQATKEFPLCFSYDAHWNTRGHAFAARFLCDYLIEHGLVR